MQVRQKTDQGVVSFVNRACRIARQISEPHKHVPTSYTLSSDKPERYLPYDEPAVQPQLRRIMQGFQSSFSAKMLNAKGESAVVARSVR